MGKTVSSVGAHFAELSLSARAMAGIVEPISRAPTIRSAHRDPAALRKVVELQKALCGKARKTSEKLRAELRSQKGELTPSDLEVLAEMLRLNLLAALRRRQDYRPGRANLAQRLRLSERTVSRALTKLTGARLILTERYAKGGRAWNKGTGLATEFATGYLHDMVTAIENLGYRLTKKLGEDLCDWAEWCEVQTRKAKDTTVTELDDARGQDAVAPTGTNVPAMKLQDKEALAKAVPAGKGRTLQQRAAQAAAVAKPSQGEHRRQGPASNCPKATFESAPARPNKDKSLARAIRARRQGTGLDAANYAAMPIEPLERRVWSQPKALLVSQHHTPHWLNNDLLTSYALGAAAAYQRSVREASRQEDLSRQAVARLRRILAYAGGGLNACPPPDCRFWWPCQPAAP